AVDHLLQQFDVLVVDEHRARLLAVDEQRVLLLDLHAGLGPLLRTLVLAIAKTSATAAETTTTKAHDYLSYDFQKDPVYRTPVAQLRAVRTGCGSKAAP